MGQTLYTTAEAAKLVGVTRTAIQMWIAAKKVTPPDFQIRNSRAVRMWGQQGIQELRKLKKQSRPGPKKKT